MEINRPKISPITLPLLNNLWLFLVYRKLHSFISSESRYQRKTKLVHSPSFNFVETEEIKACHAVPGEVLTKC